MKIIVFDMHTLVYEGIHIISMTIYDEKLGLRYYNTRDEI